MVVPDSSGYAKHYIVTLLHAQQNERATDAQVQASEEATSTYYLVIRGAPLELNNQVPAGIAPSGQLARQNLDWEGCDVIEDMHPSSLISQPHFRLRSPKLNFYLCGLSAFNIIEGCLRWKLRFLPRLTPSRVDSRYGHSQAYCRCNSSAVILAQTNPPDCSRSRAYTEFKVLSFGPLVS
eukprot:scaffold15363_cov154-Skeletonema_dohrnii-CCMP3373.AAC.1